MSGSTGFEPTRALAVVMGASRWRAGAFEDNVACRNSAEAFRAYLVDPQGLGLADDDVLAVIDDESPYPGQILERIHDFIVERKKVLEDEQRAARDLLFYYVGHGSFSESKDYFLPIFRTRGPDLEGTSIRLEALAKIIKAAARDVRSHLIFDACFSAATFQAFLSTGPADVAVQKTLHAFPSTGIALLCSAGRSDPALAPEGLRETLFTGEMIRILREGDRTAPARLSFGGLAELVSERLEKRFTDVIRPHVSSPRQKEGQLPLFPNALAAPSPAPASADAAGAAGRSAGRGDAPGNGGNGWAPGPVTSWPGPVTSTVPVGEFEGNRIPKAVQSLLLAWWGETFIGYGALAISFVCLTMAGAALWLGPSDDATGLGRIVGMVFGMSGGVAGLLFAASVGLFGLRRWRPRAPMLGPKSSPPREWEELEIMDGLRARDAVPLIGNATIGRRALLATMLLTLAALLIWAYFNWTS